MAHTSLLAFASSLRIDNVYTVDVRQQAAMEILGICFKDNSHEIGPYLGWQKEDGLVKLFGTADELWRFNDFGSYFKDLLRDLMAVPWWVTYTHKKAIVKRCFQQEAMAGEQDLWSSRSAHSELHVVSKLMPRRIYSDTHKKPTFTYVHEQRELLD